MEPTGRSFKTGRWEWWLRTALSGPGLVWHRAACAVSLGQCVRGQGQRRDRVCRSASPRERGEDLSLTCPGWPSLDTTQWPTVSLLPVPQDLSDWGGGGGEGQFSELTPT